MNRVCLLVSDAAEDPKQKNAGYGTETSVWHAVRGEIRSFGFDFVSSFFVCMEAEKSSMKDVGSCFLCAVALGFSTGA